MVGWAFTSSGEQHAVLWQNGGIQDLGTLGGATSFTSAINNLGQVVGGACISSGDLHAFVWQNGSMQDLNTLTMNLPTGVTLYAASGINDNGLIAGYTADLHAFLLIPTINVSIDIKPGSDINSINPDSKGKIAVAILSTPDFNAPEKVDWGTLKFGETGNEVSLAFCTVEDVNADGLPDLVAHFYTQLTDFQTGDVKGYLKGQTVDGIPLTGSDAVRIVPGK